MEGKDKVYGVDSVVAGLYLNRARHVQVSLNRDR